MQYGSALAIQSFLILVAYFNSSWSLVLFGFSFGLLILIIPSLARLVERSWSWIGIALARIVNPITLTILFIFIICPFGFLARAMKWLNPAFDNKTESQLIAVKTCPSQKSFAKPF